MCPDCKRPLTRMSEESYFFRLSKYQDALLKHYEEFPDAIMPRARHNEVMSFIKSGLQDLSVSRTTLKWGIPVPGDERHTVYVWFDALINYISAVGYPERGAKWETYWPHVRHMVGKDIIRFHSVIWPAVLMAIGANPPVRVFAHGWWTVEGDKMSKSKGNVVDPFEMVDVYGADPFRYFVLREVPFGNDGDFSELGMVNRINSDLANDIGNLLNRTLQMIEKYRGGKLPPSSVFSRARDIDVTMRGLAEKTLSDMDLRMDEFSPEGALKTLWALIGAGNKYIDETSPWKLGRDDPDDRLDIVLRTLWEVLRLSAMLVYPFIPGTAARIWVQLGLDGDISKERYPGWGWGTLEESVTVRKREVLFPRIDVAKWKEKYDARMKARLEALKGNAPAPTATYDTERKPRIDIEDFKKLEIRVAKIESVETVDKAKKLYKLNLDLGFETRVIVSSIREFFTPEQLTGKKILVLCNLKPATFRGIESDGMLLAAEADDGNGEMVSLAVVDDDFPAGAPVH
jgi:methionyl-tRNA synthetase